MRTNNRVHRVALKGGITRTKEFERKRLASFAVNPGTKCGHGCLYCSTGATLRTHPSFRQAGESPYGTGYAIIDPDTPERVAEDARRKRNRGLVMLCATVDAWSPEAQEYRVGSRCLQAILSQPGWTVRILTKNAAVVNDYDLIERHRERALVGLSITATGAKSHIASVIEPHASPIEERLAAMAEAHARGLRTYAMLCPLLPGISDTPQDIDWLVEFALDCDAEEIFVEPVNPRGRALQLTHQALYDHGYTAEARAVEAIRCTQNWSRYVARLVSNVQASVRAACRIDKLRFLLYPSDLSPEDERQIREDDASVVWLGKH